MRPAKIKRNISTFLKVNLKLSLKKITYLESKTTKHKQVVKQNVHKVLNELHTLLNRKGKLLITL
jgi:hypothetical protein